MKSVKSVVGLQRRCAQLAVTARLYSTDSANTARYVVVTSDSNKTRDASRHPLLEEHNHAYPLPGTVCTTTSIMRRQVADLAIENYNNQHFTPDRPDRVLTNRKGMLDERGMKLLLRTPFGHAYVKTDASTPLSDTAEVYSSDSCPSVMIDMEFSAFECPNVLRDPLSCIFPHRKREVYHQPVTVICLTQSMRNAGTEPKTEKSTRARITTAGTEQDPQRSSRIHMQDPLADEIQPFSNNSSELQVSSEDTFATTFISVACETCSALSGAGFWADFLHPKSGRPYLSPFASKRYAKKAKQQDSYSYSYIRSLLFENLDQCQLVSHVDELAHAADGRFIGVIVTNAPVDCEAVASLLGKAGMAAVSVEEAETEKE